MSATESKKHGRADDKTGVVEGEPLKKKQKLSPDLLARVELIDANWAKDVPDFGAHTGKIRSIINKAGRDVVDVIKEAEFFDTDDVKRAINLLQQAKDTFVCSLLLPYAPAHKDIDFRGTRYAMVNLGEECSRDMQGAARKFIKEADLCTDLAVTKGKPFEDKSHVTIILGLPAPGMQSAFHLQLQRMFGENELRPFKVRIGGLGHFHNSSTWEDGKVHERDVLFACVDDHEGGLGAVRKVLEPYVMEGKSDKLRGFTPHVTLAFLRYGAGAEYEKHEGLLAAVKQKEYTVTELQFLVVGDRSVAPITVRL